MNTIKSPNDHILKDSLNKTVCFKNIKTNELEEKAISSFKNIYNIMRIILKNYLESLFRKFIRRKYLKNISYRSSGSVAETNSLNQS